MNVAQRDMVSISPDSTKGREQRGKRPAVVISGNAFHISGVRIVCPITSKIHDFMGNVVLKPNPINKLTEVSEVLVGHVRSVSLERITKKIGVIQERELENIFSGIDLVFDR